MKRPPVKGNKGLCRRSGPGEREGEGRTYAEVLDCLTAYESVMPLEWVQELTRAGRAGRLVVLPEGEDNAGLAAAVDGAGMLRVWCGGDKDLLVGLLSMLAGQVADKLGIRYRDLLMAMMVHPPVQKRKEAEHG